MSDARSPNPGVRCADFRRYLSADLDRLVSESRSPENVRTAHAGGRVRRLPWDSEFFGVPAGRLDGLWRDTTVPADRAWGELMPALLARATELGLGFLDARIAADELALAQALEAEGFRLVDALAIYLHDVNRITPVPVPPRRIDAEAFLREALPGMTWGRLFAEPRVARVRAEEFYLRTSLHHLEQGAQLTVLGDDADPAGLAIGTLDAEGSRLAGRRLGELWLLIVSPRHQGKGAGKRLFNQFCAEFSAVADVVEIGTQIQNAAANRIYRSAGAAPVAHALTFHRWSG